MRNITLFALFVFGGLWLDAGRNVGHGLCAAFKKGQRSLEVSLASAPLHEPNYSISKVPRDSERIPRSCEISEISVDILKGLAI